MEVCSEEEEGWVADGAEESGCGLWVAWIGFADQWLFRHWRPSCHSLLKDRTICALDWVDIRALGRHRQDHRTAKTDVTLVSEYRIRVSRLRLRRSALSFEQSLDPLEPLDFGPDRLSLAPSWAWASLILSASPPHACSHHRIDG